MGKTSKKIDALRAKAEAEKRRLIARSERAVARAYEQAIKELSEACAALHLPLDAPFDLAKFPMLEARIAEISESLNKRVLLLMQQSVSLATSLADDAADSTLAEAYGKEALATLAVKRPYLFRRTDAAAAFGVREGKGLELSRGVWRINEAFREQMRTALASGIVSGQSATAISRTIRPLLKHPTALFRRVRDKESGKLLPSKAMQQYHPGRGVYRSAAKNARRLAATETNIAYRSADYERLQRFDFVVGVRVVLSNNHTSLDGKGVARPFSDICDELQGDYPKDFKFVGWHPHCRCHVETILKTEKELQADSARILGGEAPTLGSEREVKSMPEAFKTWISDNEERITRAESRGTLPYFLKDNRGRWKESGKEVDDNVKRLSEVHFKNETGAHRVLKRQRIEHLAIIKANGKVLTIIEGDEYGVSPSEEAIKLCKNKGIIHNHPSGLSYSKRKYRRLGHSFSGADIDFAVYADCRYIEAVTPTHIYRLERPKIEIEKDDEAKTKVIKESWGCSSKEAKDRYNEIYKGLMKEYKHSVYTAFLLQHKTMKRLSEEFGWKYTYEPIIPRQG